MSYQSNIKKRRLEETANFIMQHKDEINQREYDVLYRLADESDIFVWLLTYILFKSGIEPLKYVEFVPKYYMSYSDYEGIYRIPDNIIIIDDWTFNHSKKLTHVIIPKSVKSIGFNAFTECDKLERITYEGTIEEWNEVLKYDSWIGQNMSTTIHCTDGWVFSNTSS